MNNKTYKRFEDCIPVSGYFRSIIMDLTRKTFVFIPNILCDGISTDKLISENLPVEYIDFLLENEFIFECSQDELTFYSPLNKKWDYPAVITNAVVEIGEKQYFTKEYFEQIVELGCRHFAFVFTETACIDWFEDISKLFEESLVLTIEIYCKYSNRISRENLENIMQQNTRITYILLYEAPTKEVISNSGIRGNTVYYNKTVSYTESNIDIQIFNVNMSLFTESLHYNNFYNRKLCIDKEGGIKNYFTQEKSFGNIFDDKISDIVQTKSFQKLWYIHKDMVDICKECEFRYVCVDSRYPLQRDTKNYYFKEECSYNPYIYL